LLVALDRKDLKELPETPPKDNPPLEQRVGFTWAWAYRGQLGEARNLALASGPASHQLQALIALIAALVEKRADIGVDLVAAIERADPALKEKDANVSPWTLYRLVQLGARGGNPDQVAKIVPLISDADLRCRADLEIILATLQPHSTDEKWNELAAGKPPCRHALLVLSRHNTRYGSSSAVSKAVNNWEPELRPLGFAGIALGMQDAEK
jgi:hypothetical protein